MPRTDLRYLVDCSVQLANAIYGATQNLRFLGVSYRTNNYRVRSFFNNSINTFIIRNGDRVFGEVSLVDRLMNTQELIQYLASRISSSNLAGRLDETGLLKVTISPSNRAIIEEYCAENADSHVSSNEITRQMNAFVSNISTEILARQNGVTRELLENLETSPENWQDRCYIDGNNEILYQVNTNIFGNSYDRLYCPIQTQTLEFISELTRYHRDIDLNEEDFNSIFNPIIRNYYRSLISKFNSSNIEVIRTAASLQLIKKLCNLYTSSFSLFSEEYTRLKDELEELLRRAL